jgi:hypothetical protein
MKKEKYFYKNDFKGNNAKFYYFFKNLFGSAQDGPCLEFFKGLNVDATWSEEEERKEPD